MKPLKPVFMKTYGKERRKLSAWLSPENRKQAFDSTRSTDGDMSVFEPAKPTKTRKRRTSTASQRPGRPAKKKAMLCLAEKSSDEENTLRSSFLQPPQQNKRTRGKKTSIAFHPAKKKAKPCVNDTSSDEERMPSPPCPRPTQQSKNTSLHPPSTGRFVTRRRRAPAPKPKLPKAVLSILNSSDDFTSGAFSSRKILRPSRRRAAVAAFLVSSAENSVNAAGTASFATNPFREIYLNESTDQSLGPCSRKPIFCSTPSAGFFSKRPRLKPLSVSHQSASPPSISVSCISALSISQEDLDSPGRSISAPPNAVHSERKLQSSLSEQEPDLHHHEEPSGGANKSSSISEEARSHSEDITSKNAVRLPSLNLLSSNESESSSRFVSAEGGLEWLIEALKEKCLTERCTVQLERWDILTMSQLSSQTTYSSCLEHSNSAHGGTNEHLTSVDGCQTVDLSQSSVHLHQSVSNMKPSDYMNSFESSEHAASVTGSQSANNSPFADHSSTQESMEQSASVLYVDSSHHRDSSFENESLTKKCTVQLKRMDLSQHKSDMSKSENEYTHNSEDAEDLTCSGEITETEENAATLTKLLKEKCLSDKVNVQIKRVTLSQLKEILQLEDTKLKDSASDEETNNSDTNQSNDKTSDIKVNLKKRASEKTALDKDEVEKDIPQKRKKTSLAPKEKKRRSTSTDRPGTARKACVSGLSVSRWKNKGSNSSNIFSSRAGSNKAVDCSINELMSQHKQPTKLFGTTMNFSTPMKGSRLNLSSLLADLTPNTHTWSRLKAALSIHRKGMVRLTPSSLCSPRRAEAADVSRDLFATPFRTPLSKRFKSQLLGSDTPVMCEDEDEELSDAEKVYAECGQQRPLPWEECIVPQRMKRCVKIGEGTFGEVFSTTNASGDTVALKIIPLEGSEKVNGEDQKSFGEILHEIIISKELSSLKEKQQNMTQGFIGLKDLHCVQGCYPPDFMKAWDTFDQRKGSENDRPDFFVKDQLFLILEFEFGGMDLENSNGTLTSLAAAKSILHQVTAALAVAEQELHFEHRDLHWGNVLVKTTKQKTGSFLLNGVAHFVETKGVLVRIIDYSLSRLEIDNLTVSCDISSDEELFMGQGDYQFDIYRLMRQENGNNWSDYHPHTNVLWLHYLCSKLLSMKYRSAGGRVGKGMREELTRFYDNVLQYSSATEALQSCPMFQ
ncbi:uncharacterized protein haspin [Centropristis striata]|uniref:uncharacterized protein haspin n=1 Tax=Centropristis striata TaxID=184440 RepID=UPI0027DF2E53|nr:uncharacterized protein haspin [Centropristis striata]